MPMTGLEPVRSRPRQILSLMRLPIPPHRHMWRMISPPLATEIYIITFLFIMQVNFFIFFIFFFTSNYFLQSFSPIEKQSNVAK